MLINQAAVLCDLGEHRQTDSAIREVIEIYQQHDEPGSLNPSLAGAHSTRSETLTRLDERPQALAEQREAVALYRRLAAASSEAYEPHLAKALYLLGRRYQALGLWAQAGRAVSEAVHRLATSPGRSYALFGKILEGYKSWLAELAHDLIPPSGQRELSRTLRRGERLMRRIAGDPRAAASA